MVQAFATAGISLIVPGVNLQGVQSSQGFGYPSRYSSLCIPCCVPYSVGSVEFIHFPIQIQQLQRQDQAQTKTSSIFWFAPTSSATSLLHKTLSPTQQQQHFFVKQSVALNRQVEMAPSCEFAFSSPPPLFSLALLDAGSTSRQGALRLCDSATLPLNPSRHSLILLSMEPSFFVAYMLPLYIRSIIYDGAQTKQED